MNERELIVETMKLSEARQQFSQVLNRVYRGQTRVVVEKSGIPMAAIISVQDLESFKRMESQRAERFRVLEESWKAFEGVPLEEVEREVAKAVAAARRKHRTVPKDAKAS